MVVSDLKRPTPFDIREWLRKRFVPAVDSVFDFGYNALHIAAYYCDAHALRALLAYQNTVPFLYIDSPSHNRTTPLMVVCTNDATTTEQKENMIKYMIYKLKASATATSSFGENIAAYAMRANLSPRFLTWLFNHAQVPTNSMTRHKITLLGFAAKIGSIPYLEAIYNQGDITKSNIKEAVCVAAGHGSLLVLKALARDNFSLLLTKTFPKNAPGIPNGASLLHLACIGNHWNVCEYLLSKIPKLLNLPDANGVLPLMYATSHNFPSIVSSLIKHDSQVVFGVSPVSGDSALHIACRFGLVEVIDILLEAGSDVALTNGTGDTPLHCLASFTPHNPTPEQILTYKNTMTRLVQPTLFDINRTLCFATNRAGNTPFLVAALACNQLAMEYLAIDLAELVYDAHQQRQILPFVALAGHHSIELTAHDNVDKTRSRAYSFSYRKRSSSLTNYTPSPPAYHTARSVDVLSLDNMTASLSDIDICQEPEDYASSSGYDHLPSHNSPHTRESLYEYSFRFKRIIADSCNKYTFQGAPHLALLYRRSNPLPATPSLLLFLYATLGCKMHLPDVNGNTPFIEACRSGNYACVLWLKSFAGVVATPSFENYSQVSAFLLACASGSVELVKWMVEHYRGDPASVHRLLEQRDFSGLSPIMAASFTGHLNILEYLDAYAKSLDFLTPLQKKCGAKTRLCLSANSWRYMLLTQTYGEDKKTCLLLAAQSGYLNVVEWIVAQLGFDACVSTRDAHGNDILYYSKLSQNSALVAYCESLVGSATH